MKTKDVPLAATVLIGCFPIVAVFAQSAQPMMKAAVVHEPGGPESLKYEDTPRPAPKDDEVLVKVVAAGVNPVDTYIRQGMRTKKGSNNDPMIIGYDIAGVIEKAGAGIKTYKAGDAVYAYLPVSRGGGYAEFAIAKEDEMSLKPKNIDFEKAAAAPLAATTAWQALIDVAKLEPGQTVLIHGGSGGVGCFAVQIAKARGAKVIATASTANQDLLKQLGVDQPIDYTKTKFEEVVKEVDVVLNCVRGDTLSAVLWSSEKRRNYCLNHGRAGHGGMCQTRHSRIESHGAPRRQGARRADEADRGEQDHAYCVPVVSAEGRGQGAPAGGDPSYARQDCAKDR